MYEEKVKVKRNWKSIIFRTIIAILVILICFFLFRSLIDKKDTTTSKNTFASNFQTLKGVAEKYYTNDKLPTEIGKTNKVTLKQLIEESYIEPIKDSNGKSCSTSNSYAEMKKTATNKYSLKVQLSCDDEQNYIISTITLDDEEPVEENNKPEEKIEENKPEEKVEENKTDIDDKESVNTTKIPETNNNSNNTEKKSTTSSSTTSKSTTSNSSKKTTTTNKTTTNNTTTTTTTNNTTTTNTNNTNNTTTNTNTVVPVVYYVVTFNPKGCKVVPTPQNIKKGQLATKPTDPTKTGYKFLGWYYNGKPFDFNTQINQNYELYAEWQKIN